MEESKNCSYCKQIMTYGPRKQVLCQSIMKEGKIIQKSVTYILYCWCCPMEEDDCDIILDNKDINKNKHNIEEAEKQLQKEITNYDFNSPV